MKKTYCINSNRVEIDYENKCISSLKFNDEEMIEGKIPFFSIKLRDSQGKSYIVTAFDFKLSGSANDIYLYSRNDLNVKLVVKQTSNSLIWNIDVLNKTHHLIEQVELMSLGLCPKLIEEGGKGEIVYPYNEGARVTSIARREACAFKYFDVDYPSYGIYSVFPNMIFAPFMAYIHKNMGVFLGFYDKEYTPKHIDFKVENGILKTVMGTFCNVNYGESYHMNYDSMMTFFEGNYFDACEIYRKWFKDTNAYKYKTIKENYNLLPKWYHESPVVISYPVVGKKDSDLEMKPGGLYPYTNALPVIDYYSNKTESKIMVVLMQWESTAPWAPPYVWPPYGDEQDFYKYRDELHKNGNYLGVYTSGFGYTIQSFRRDYNKQEEFDAENIKDIVCTNTDGFMKSTVVDEIRFGYDICPALEKSKQIFIDEAKKMIDADLDYVQILDQNHGGSPYFCYSKNHGHIPAPGKWQVEETLKLLKRVDCTKTLLGCESAASEPYIGELLFSDNRYILNHHVGEPIPMYSYMYHEYVNNFMGNQICSAVNEEEYSLTYRMAYSFISGDMYTIIIDGNGKVHTAWCHDKVVDDDMPLTLIKNTNKWRIGKFEEFLHYGKMVKPVDYICNKKSFKYRDADYYFHFNAVLSNAYTNGIETYQFFINYDKVEETISLEDKDYIVYFDNNKEPVTLNGKNIVVPPLSLIAIKL